MYYITSILVPRGRWNDFVCIGDKPIQINVVVKV